MREIEVLKLKIKDQVVISNISTILKQLGHEETLNKSHELAEILISKISTLEKSFKSQRSEEKKQILTKEQHKFKEIFHHSCNLGFFYMKSYYRIIISNHYEIISKNNYSFCFSKIIWKYTCFPQKFIITLL